MCINKKITKGGIKYFRACVNGIGPLFVLPIHIDCALIESEEYERLY